ncbi:MAG: DNA-3-methyladenine glycosylase [Acidobacteriota bacterium]|nr:DNA-3-methyladenine glycosylase [Acidobacteriota bacterium]
MQTAIEHLKADPILRAIIERVGDYTIQFREPTFESLVRSIVFQQLSGKVATVIFNRLATAVPDGRLTPENIMKLRPERMRKLGLSGQKIAYIRDLAKHVKRGKVSFAELPQMPDEQVIEHLTQVKGIGVWTAHMFLMFALQRHNVLPTGDLGIRSAIRKAYAMNELPTVAEVEKLAAGWHPYCSIACWYLWRSLENQATI